MNNKIIFYTTYMCSSTAYRSIFEVVIDDGRDPDEVIESLISPLFEEYSMDVAFDWIFVNSRDTEDDTSPDGTAKLIKTHRNKISFPSMDRYVMSDVDKEIAKLNRQTEMYKRKAAKIRGETERIKAETRELQLENEKLAKEGNRPNVWIEPDGTSHEVGFASHNSFARDWIQNHSSEERYQEVLDGSGYWHEALEEAGWIRVMGWSSTVGFVITKRITPKQKMALSDYCNNQSVPYADRPDILKS